MRSLLLGAAAIAMLPASASAATILDGGFETAPATGNFTTVAGGGSIGAWTVLGNSVDHIGLYWTNNEGSRSIDLSGGGAGGVRQTFATVANQAYAISFWLAGNPDGGSNLKSVAVDVGGAPSIFQFDTTGHTTANMGWQQFTYNFVASGTSTTLSFMSQNNDPYGPALDNVSVSAVPEPAAWAMMLLGVGLIGGMMRRRNSVRFANRITYA